MVVALLVALFAHYVADFPGQAFFQSHMGKKATRLDHLLWHVLAYTTIFFMVCGLFITTRHIFMWVMLNGALHGVIDFWTSKASYGCHYRALPRERADLPAPWRGAFWCVIGFDQFLHMAFMVWSGFALGVF